MGLDLQIFRPECWLREDLESRAICHARLPSIRNCYLSFGMGNHPCARKNLAKMEVFKVLATLFRQFNICLAEPGKDWKVNARFFNMQLGFKVFLKAR